MFTILNEDNSVHQWDSEVLSKSIPYCGDSDREFENYLLHESSDLGYTDFYAGI